MDDFNLFNPNIKLTYEYSGKSISFLDLKIENSQGKLFTSLYIKLTYCHQYLHYKSSHPEHTKPSIIYSQALRIKRLCSLEKDFKYHISQMKSWFLKRGYPERIVTAEMSKVKFQEDKKRVVNKKE